MGKASRWLRAIFGLKKPDPPLTSSSQEQQQPIARSKEKRRWSFVKSHREKDKPQNPPAIAGKSRALYGQDVSRPVQISSSENEEDPNKHAIAVAAATAAVAEAAVAAAHAAAEVVRLTSSGRSANYPAAYVSGSLGLREDLAAVKIQAAFRGYLARRALRALRALVRLQALVRGHIERKRTAEWFHRMQSLLRAQARVRAGCLQVSESPYSSSKSSHSHHPGPPTPEKFEHPFRSKSGKYKESPMLKRTRSKANGRAITHQDKAHLSLNWSERRMDERSWDQQVTLTRTGVRDDEKSDKILEIDTVKPHVIASESRNLFPSSHHGLASDQYSHSFTTSKESTTRQTVPSPSSGEVRSLSQLKFSHEVEEEAFCTAENSPQFYSASSMGGSGKRSPFTPSKGDGSRSFLSSYSDYYPNYMSYTESSRAKVRSVSAPKQRPQYERSGSTKRYSINGFGEPRSSCAQRASALGANFANRAYPGSGRLDRLGMPIGQRY